MYVYRLYICIYIVRVYIYTYTDTRYVYSGLHLPTVYHNIDANTAMDRRHLTNVAIQKQAEAGR